MFLHMPGIFLSTEIDSKDFKNENLTTNIRRNKAEKPYLKKKNITKDLETDGTIKQKRNQKKYCAKK